jgi:hypothetical protein
MTTAATPETVPLIGGEVRTCLLPSSVPLPDSGDELLDLRAGERVLLSERPNSWARSADVLTGVDCCLPTGSRARVRAVGTLVSRAILVDGCLLQSSTRFQIIGSPLDRRREWGHYLVRPGTIEPLGRLSVQDVARGLLTGQYRPGEMAVGATTERLLGRVLRHPLLDQRPPFKSPRTRFRWVAERDARAREPRIQAFTLAEDGLRTMELTVPATTPRDDVAAWCEDVARHDWLLTILVRIVERSRLGQADGRDTLSALRPAVGHLLHLWMPGARTVSELRALWSVLEEQPGFSRQWLVIVQRIRDQLALQLLRTVAAV